MTNRRPISLQALVASAGFARGWRRHEGTGTGIPEMRRRCVAAATTLRISATLLSTPLNLSNFAFVIAAMIWASVVFPVPGGPEKMTDGNRSASIARRRSLPGARMCSCPTNSSSERGRIRLASGAAASAATSVSASVKRSSTEYANGAGCICQPLDRGDALPHSNSPEEPVRRWKGFLFQWIFRPR